MTLLLHTSSPTIRIGLAEGDRIVAREHFPTDRNLAEILADRVRQLFRKNTFHLSAVRSVVVHAGPVSRGFTSLRIGVTTANAVAYALGIPVVGVAGDISALDGLLEQSKTVAPPPSGIVIPLYAKEPDIGPVPTR